MWNVIVMAPAHLAETFFIILHITSLLRKPFGKVS